MKASVVICTYNRAGLLKESIISIQKQDFKADHYEIIVVDNNSTDDTKAVVLELASVSPVAIKYVFEKQQGLSFARNSGIKGSEGDVIVFTDDDVEAESQWLREMVSAFDDPDTACAGGPIRPIWLSERPDWLTDRWLNYYAVSEFAAARETLEFSYPHCPWGANIAFRRGVFETVGLFPTDLGRVGPSLLSNEEINLCRKIGERGKRIKFAPGAVIHHKISPKRVKKQWLYHRTYWQGRSDAVLYKNTDMNIYAELRTHASVLLRREVERRESEFDIKCGDRIARGYFHQLLFSGSRAANNFRGLRALETFIGELIKTAGRLVRDEKSKVFGTLDEKLKRLEESIRTFGQFKQYEEQLRQKDQLIGSKDEILKEYEEQLRQKDQLICSKDEILKEYEDRLKYYEKSISDFQGMLKERERLEVQIAQRNNTIEEIRSSMSWKITAPLRTGYGILLRRRK